MRSFEKNLWTGVFIKFCEQEFLTIVVNNCCEQKLWIKVVSKNYE